MTPSQRLVEATQRCLRRHGLSGTTSRVITAEAGMNLGSITYHFGSKDELVAQALMGAVRTLLDPALEVLRSDLDPAARTLAAVQALRAGFEEAGDLVPVYIEALVNAPRIPALARQLDQLFGEIRAFLAAQMAELKQQGYVPSWVDPDAMAMLHIALADGIALHAALDAKSIDRDAVGAQMASLLLAARSDPAPPPPRRSP